MLNRNNDCMSVLIGDSPEGGYIITDLGDTIADLESSGIMLSSGKRTDKLSQILRGFGVEKNDAGEIFVRASINDLALKMNMLIQAMASVDDLFLLSQDTIRDLFNEEVGRWMVENDIRTVDGPSFSGKSGLMYKFDYAIGRSKTMPERLIKTVNTPTDANVRNALFGWSDVESERNDALGYVFLNAANGKGGEVPSSVINACRNYGMKAVCWGINHDSFLKELAA